jgi:hypothetical protein
LPLASCPPQVGHFFHTTAPLDVNEEEEEEEEEEEKDEEEKEERDEEEEGLNAATVMTSGAEPVPSALCALISTSTVPVAVGVPDNSPVLVLRLSQPGRPVAP